MPQTAVGTINSVQWDPVALGAMQCASGSGFGASPGTVTINGVAAGVASWADTQVCEYLPNSVGTGSGSIQISNAAGTSNAVSFAVIGDPAVSGAQPRTTTAGAQVTIAGTNFGSTGSVSLSGGSSGPVALGIVSWSGTQIVATVPSGLQPGTYGLQVSADGTTGNFGIIVVVAAGTISWVRWDPIALGVTQCAIGSGFGPTQGTVTINGVAAAVASWADTQVCAYLPNSVGTGAGSIQISNAAGASNTVSFAVVAAPAVSGVQPRTTVAGAQITITGTNFGSTGSVVLSGGSSGPVALGSVSWSGTQIVGTVPSGLQPGTYGLQVSADGTTGNFGVIVVVAPGTISSVQWDPIALGATQCAIGSGFGPTQGTVTINGVAAGVASWADTQVCEYLPNSVGTGAGSIQISNVAGASNAVSFAVVAAPAVTGVQPRTTVAGAQITITGTSFGSTGSASLSGGSSGPVALGIVSWGGTQIVGTVPSGLQPGTYGLQVSADGTTGNFGVIVVVAPGTISSVQWDPIALGATQCAIGSGFGPTQGTVTINGAVAGVASWADTQVCEYLPNSVGAGSGSIQISNAAGASNAVSFAVVAAPAVTGVQPRTTVAGSQITITGTSFGSTGSVSLSGGSSGPVALGIVSWSGTQIVGTVPSGLQPGNYGLNVSADGTTSGSNGGAIVVVAPGTISSVQWDPVALGAMQCAIGSGFGPTQGTVTINGVAAGVASWADTQVCEYLPNSVGTGAGSIQISNAAGASNAVSFAVIGDPAVSGVQPRTTGAGAQVTVTGTNFGSAGSVLLYGGSSGPVTLGIASWSGTQIVGTVPSGLQPGTYNLQVSAGGTTANGGPLFVVATTPPVISTLTPVSGTVGTPITITGSGFGATQGTTTVSFNGVAAPVTNWSDTSISVSVPSGATTGSVVVTVGGQASNGLAFSVDNSILNGSFSPTVTAVTLTSFQAFDWIHWGTSSDNPLVRMAGVTPLLSDFTAIGSNSPAPFTSGETEYLWTDGDPLPSAERTVSGVAVSGTGNGFHLSVPTDTSAQTLVLYVGVNNGQSQLTASLSDGSVSSFVDSSLNSGANNFLAGTYSIDFRATQPGQTLNLDYVLLSDQGNGTTAVGQVTLDSAELFPHLPVVAMTAPADGQVFNQATSINIAASASQIATALSKVDLLSDAQVLLELTSPPYSLSATGLSAGDHLLAASATDANGLTTTSDPVLVAQIQGGGLLTGSTSTPANIDLSAGTSDWVHWGNTAPANNLDRKAGISSQISDLTLLANGSDHPFDASGNNGTSFSWASGTPTDSQSGTATQLQMRGYKNGFKLTVAADTTVRTLNLYVASGHGQSTLRASLSDGSAVPFVSVSSATTPFAETFYTIQFQAASAGQRLTITDQVTRDDGFAFVALESASVSDQNPPQISSVSPATAAPGAQITISGSNFGSTQGSAQVTLSGATMNVISWSDNSITATVPLTPSGAVIVSRGLANSNGVPFAVILPPPPSIGFIRPSVGGEGTAVTIFGSNFGSIQNNSTVTFNGLAASPTFWSDGLIVVPAPVGVHSGPVVVTTVSGASNGVVFTFSPGIRFAAQTVYVTPDETNLEVGGSTVFRMVDPSGTPVSDAVWKVDSSTIASISPDSATPANGNLQALAPGEVTITGTSSLGTAQAKATIYATGQTPAGTAVWSFYPQVQDNFFASSVKSRRNSPDAPFMYLPEATDNLPTVSALDEGGQLQWRVTLNPIAPSNTDIFPVASPATDDGGILIQTFESDPNGPGEATGFYRLGPDGKQLWTYSVPGVDTSGPAIAQDGTIFFWGTANTNFGLLALDDTTGQLKMNLNPLMGDNISTTSTEQPSAINPDRTPVDTQHPWKPCSAFFPPGQFNPPNPSGGGNFSFQPVIGTEGSVYVVETVVSSSFNYDTCLLTQIFDPNPNNPPAYFIDTLSGQLQFAETLQLHRIMPKGQIATTQLGSVSYSGTAKMSASGFTVQWAFTDTNGNAAQLPAVDFDEVIPNADRGAVVTWAQRLSTPEIPFQGFFTNVVNNAAVLNAPLPFPESTSFSSFGNMAVNDQGTMFLDHFGLSVTTFDLGTGNLKWSAPGSLVVLSDDGDALIKNAIFSEPGSVQAFDQNGTAATDSLILGKFAAYIAEGMFLQNGPAGSIQVVQTNDQLNQSLNKALAGPWPMPAFDNPQQNNRAEGIKKTEFVEAGETEGCTGFDKTIELNAVMAPDNTGQQVPETGNSFNFRAPNGINMALIAADTTFVTLSVDDPTHPTQLTAVVPGDGVSHQVTLRGHGSISPNDMTNNCPRFPGTKCIKFLAFNADTNDFLGFAFQAVVLPFQTWDIHKFEIGDAARNIHPGETPAASDLAAELNRIFYRQANIQFGVTERGLVDAFDWDQAIPDKKMHEPGSWDAKDNVEAKPLHEYILEHVDPQLSTDLSTMYVYYVNDFDKPTTEGFTVQFKANRAIPSLIKTQFDSLTINVLTFISNLTSHEIGHKLGLPDRPQDDVLFVMDRVRTGNSLFRANNTPCKLDSKEWVITNKPLTGQ